jgi:UDP-glucose 4-epimerase
MQILVTGGAGYIGSHTAKLLASRWMALRYFNVAGADPDGEIGEDHDPETHLIPLVIGAAQGRRPPVQIYGTDYATADGTASSITST